MNPESMWQLLKKISPDQIILSCRPDKNIPNFKINLSNPKTGKLSTRKYMEQLYLKEPILYSNFSVFTEVVKNLEKKYGLDFSKKGLKIEKTENQIYLNEEKIIKRNRLSEKIPEKLMTTASLFANYTNCPLMLGDLPDIIHRERVCNSLTVAQIKEILKQSAFALGRSPKLSPENPVNVCYNNIHPVNGQGNGWGNPYFNLFSPINDFYMAILIAHLCKKGFEKPKRKGRKLKSKICVLSTPGSNSGIRSFLEMIEMGQIPKDLLVNENQDSRLHLEDLLEVPDPLKNLFSKSYIEEIIEKNAIWDVLMDPYKPSFKNSTAIITKYLNKDDYRVLTWQEIEEEKEKVREANSKKELFDLNKVTRQLSYSEKFDELQYLYQCLYTENQKLFFKMLNEGKEGIKTAYYKEAINSI